MENKKPLIITGVIILALIAGFLGYELNVKSKENTMQKSQIATMNGELDEMEKMIRGNGLGELMEGDITLTLTNLLDEYSEVKTDNQELTDSILNQKKKVTLLLKELKSSERKRRLSARELFKIRKETTVLRKVMRDYVHRVDSLNTLNKELAATIVVKDRKITKISGERDKLQTKSDEQLKELEKGSKLQILNLLSEAINVRRSGSFSNTTRTRRADQIKSCFTIVRNTITESGAKIFYMRIIGPDGKVLTNKDSEKVLVDGNEMQMSVSRTIDYQNNSTDLCIFFEKTTKNFKKGEFTIEIYSENLLVGTSKIALR